MLKRLFTSNTRIKLLTVFLNNPDQEYFIRELTRKLNEQINSIRRELDNLKKLGFLQAKMRNRKKYYTVNQDFIFLEEFKSIFNKANSNSEEISKTIKNLGEVKLLVLSGQFINKPTESVDMLIVGEVDREKLAHYLDSELRTQRSVRLSILNEEDYKYRRDCKDKFITDLLNDTTNHIPIQKI